MSKFNHDLRCQQFLTTRQQREAILRVFNRQNPDFGPKTGAYKKFRKTVVNYGDFLGVEWAGMFLGIERDGYTHS